MKISKTSHTIWYLDEENMRRYNLDKLTPAEKLELLTLLEEKEKRQKYRFFDDLFPSEGLLCLENYPKHKKFFGLGVDRRERCLMAGNRVGKTIAAGYELVCHLTGRYPAWWKGRRFDSPIRGLAAGDTLDTTKDILQQKLFGGIPDSDEWGTGLVPHRTIKEFTRWSGKTGLVSEINIEHVSGGNSTLKLRSYDQGRKTFQGTELDVVWLDEEVPQDVYEEALIRTMTTNGLVMLTFTPLEGLTPLVTQFLPGGDMSKAIDSGSGKALVMAEWDDAPHLSEQDKKEMLDALPPHQRDARSKGIPSLGSGAIYPVAENEIVVAPFKIPAYWPKAYGLDVGWNRTAAIWGAWDRDADVVYLYSEHYRGQAEPSIHAEAIKARGKWIPGVIDPASKGRSQGDGKQLLSMYEELGLDLLPANNAVEAGIYEVWQRLSTGRLKVFSTLTNFLSEYRIYRRDKKGKIVKDNDHLQDSLRYLIKSGLDRAAIAPMHKSEPTITSGAIGDATVGY